MNIENLITSQQQRQIFELLKSQGSISLTQVQMIYASDAAARGFLERLSIYDLIVPTETPGLWRYKEPTGKIPITDSKIAQAKYMNVLLNLRNEFENVIPELYLLQLAAREGLRPIDAIAIRNELISQGRIKMNERGAIVLLDETVRFKEEVSNLKIKDEKTEDDENVRRDDMD